MIDVIIPVYKGLGPTRRCIESVLTHRQADALEVVAVDDATPEPEIAAYLDGLAASGRVALIRHRENRGFVEAVNAGMSLHPDRDVVLLNSDTEVANDWLDRLAAAGRRSPDIGTVTPFSNNATICSYPFDGWTGGVPGTLGLERLDRLFASTHAGVSVDLPTGVGFCMFIRRDCLAAMGLFDARRFGRGYGEENDFCMRAAKAGWRNVLAADVFVFHEGAVSFSDERFTLMPMALAALLEVHPEYLDAVRAFIDANPAARLRSAIDEARASLGVEEALHVLAERSAERERLAVEFRNLEKFVMEREATIGELNRSLAAALAERDAGAAERNAAVCALNDEIARLSEGLRHAESLAFARAAELDRIRGLPLWKYYEFVMRHASRRPGAEAPK